MSEERRNQERGRAQADANRERLNPQTQYTANTPGTSSAEAVRGYPNISQGAYTSSTSYGGYTTSGPGTGYPSYQQAYPVASAYDTNQQQPRSTSTLPQPAYSNAFPYQAPNASQNYEANYQYAPRDSPYGTTNIDPRGPSYAYNSSLSFRGTSHAGPYLAPTPRRQSSR